jgi:hypothetical protein
MVRVVALCVVLWQSWAAFALDEHKREQEKHAAPTQYLVPSIWDSIKVAANLTVWGLGYAGTVVEVAKEWGGLGGKAILPANLNVYPDLQVSNASPSLHQIYVLTLQILRMRPQLRFLTASRLSR